MKRIFLFFTLAVLQLLWLPLTATAYQHSLELNSMTFSWSVEGQQIHIQLTAKTTSWVGIGFNPEKAMSGANIIIGVVEDGKFKVEDHYANRKTGHTRDDTSGGENNILNPSGSEKNGVTTISFSLLLNSGDKYDPPITPVGMTKVMLAFGRGKDSFKTHHPFRYIYDVNLSTGENKKIK